MSWSSINTLLNIMYTDFFSKNVTQYLAIKRFNSNLNHASSKLKIYKEFFYKEMVLRIIMIEVFRVEVY